MLFVQEQYQYLVKNFINQEHFVVSQFENQEFLLQFSSLRSGQKIVVIGSLTAPADQVMQLLLLLHSLHVQGAMQTILFSPYLGYQRQDKLQHGVSWGLQWADAMLYAAGVNQIITIETHCPSSLSLLKTPVFTYNSEIFFEEEMAWFVQQSFGFIFPDAGSVARYQWIFEKFPQVNTGFFDKCRIFEMVELNNFQGKMSRKVIIVDDILDSGQTMVQLCIILRQMGVEEIVIFVTHAFFNGQAWNNLWQLGVQYIYCTDTTAKAHVIVHPKIRCKFINFLLQKYI